MNKELELEAEEFAINNHLKKYKLSGEKDKDCFIKGATSKWVEKQKLQFAIEQLKSLEPTDYDIEYSSADLRYFRNELRKRRVELEQKLSEL